MQSGGTFHCLTRYVRLTTGRRILAELTLRLCSCDFSVSAEKSVRSTAWWP